MVVNSHGRCIDFEAAIELMDDELWEMLAREDHGSNQQFFDAYCKAHLQKFGKIFEPDKPNPVW